MFDDKEKENFAFCLTSSVVVFFIELYFNTIAMCNCSYLIIFFILINFLYYSFLQKNIKILS